MGQNTWGGSGETFSGGGNVLYLGRSDNTHVHMCACLSKLYSCTSKRVKFIVYILNLNWADLEWLGFDSEVGKISRRRKKQPTPVSLPGKFHGQKNLVGFSPWGHKQDTTEQLTEHTYNCTSKSVHFIVYILNLNRADLEFKITVMNHPELGRIQANGLLHTVSANPSQYNLFFLRGNSFIGT